MAGCEGVSVGMSPAETVIVGTVVGFVVVGVAAWLIGSWE